MKLKLTVVRAQLIKAIVRRMLEIDAEHAYAAHFDAMFDAGEWSEPAHDRMCEARKENLLSRLSAPERALAEDAYFAQISAGSSQAVQEFYQSSGLTVH